jgi:hypothetical protein
MVSYASSIERSFGETVSVDAIPVRRAHRLAYLIAGAALGSLVGAILPSASDVPLIVATLSIGALGNYSAVRRILRAPRLDAESQPRARVPQSPTTDHVTPWAGARR